jgi:hypothetical protein
MKTLFYPKTYATILSIRNKDDEWPYRPCAPVWTVQTDDGEVFEVKDPSRSGHTPPAVRSAWYNRKVDKKGRSEPYIYLVGFRITLYQRPQDAPTKWCYRHLGQ